MPTQKTYTVYKFSELPIEAQQLALKNWRDDNEEVCFLEENLTERLHELLKENYITPLKNGYNEDKRVLYSLGHSQGDGAMFEGRFVWDKYPDYVISIKQSGNYSHSNSKTIAIEDEEGESAPDKVYEEFEVIYQSICRELERAGYEQIEYENSEEYITELFEANDYNFTLNGKID